MRISEAVNQSELILKHEILYEIYDIICGCWAVITAIFFDCFLIKNQCGGINGGTAIYQNQQTHLISMPLPIKYDSCDLRQSSSIYLY